MTLFTHRALALHGIIFIPAILIIILLGTPAFCVQSPVFGGGMALHGAYVNFTSESGAIKGFMRGLGGRLHFNLGKYFRIGGAGAALSTEYGDRGSFFNLDYGGLSAEFKHRISRMQFSAGLAAGGGAITHLHVNSSLPSSDIQARYERYSSLLLVPMIGAEFFAGKTISFSAGLDYMLGTKLGAGKNLGGPKIQAGVLFNR